MRKLIRKAHESLDRIENMLAAIQNPELYKEDAWLDFLMQQNWVIYSVNKDNQVAVTPSPGCTQ